MEPKRLLELHFASLAEAKKRGDLLSKCGWQLGAVALAFAGSMSLASGAENSPASGAPAAAAPGLGEKEPTQARVEAEASALELPSGRRGWQFSGSLGFETSSFIRSSVDRGPQSTTWQLQARGEKSVTGGLDFVGDLRVLALDLDGTSITPDLPEIYLSTAPGRLGHHSVSLGRRKFVWSELDEHWRLGLWTPRLTWDPFRPDPVGQVGAFYQFKSRRWNVLVFGTPISVPERSFPLREEAGHLVSSSPFWNAPFETVQVMGRTVDLHYSLVMPQLSQLLLAPQGAISVSYGESKGSWFRANYGAGATNQVALAVDAGLDLTSLKIESNLHPRRQLRQIATFEAGYRGQIFDLWSSFSGEVISPENLPAGWISSPSGTSLYSSVGAGVDWGYGFRMDAQVLSVDLIKENPSNVDPTSAAAMGASFLPGRFVFEKAVDARVSWKGPSPIHYGARWLMDLKDQSQMVSVDLSYVPARAASRSRWSLRLGADFIFTESGSGQMGQQQGNDRLRGGLSYAL